MAGTSADKIISVLRDLDLKDDSLWTADGSPRIDVVAQRTGLGDLKRADITNAAPEFVRTHPKLPGDPETDNDPTPPPAEEELQELDPKAARVRQLQAELDKCEDRLKTLAEAEAQLKRERAQVDADRDELTEQLERLQPKQGNMSAILEFQQSQNRLRLEKAQRRQQALQGLDVAALQSRSQLDQAMARSQGRGHQRPQRPPITP